MELEQPDGAEAMTHEPHAADEWLRTNEAEDVAASVRHALRCRAMIQEDPHAWKWLALALHASLQGALVCHLVTTARPLGAVTKKNALEWLRYHEKRQSEAEARPPKTRLLPLPELIKRARKPYSAGDGREGAVEVSDAELNWLDRFHQDVRNQFVHFEPMGWSLEVSGLRPLGGLVARMIEDALAIGWAFRRQDVAWRETLKADLRALALND